MAIRQGKTEDIKEIMNVIEEATKDMNEKKIYQWDEIYPDEAVIRDDIADNNLYVYVNEDNIIEGIIVLNECQDEAYEALKWEYNSGDYLVIHRLCIHPKYQGKGIARKLAEFAEKFAVNGNYESIRLDAFVQNPRACRLYEKSGYKRRGTVTFRKGDFYCYEKGITVV